MGPRTTIEDLPGDVLVDIFSYLNFNELVHSVQHVCSQWRQVAQYTTKLWKCLVFQPYRCDYSERRIASTLQQMPKLRILSFKHIHMSSKTLHTLVVSCSYLTKVEFHNNQVLTISFLQNLVSNCPNIEHLHLPAGIMEVKESAKIIGLFMKMQILKLGGNDESLVKVPVLLKAIADGCPSLQYVDLGCNIHIHEELEYFLHKKRDQLHTLFLSCVVGFRTRESSIPLLSVCRVLKNLYIHHYSCCLHTFNSMIRPLQQLCMLSTVTVLYLDVILIDFAIDDVINVFTNKGMSQLTELCIICYEEYDDRLAYAVIENCPKLQVLHFKECFSLTDKSVRNFYTLKDLRNVNLHNCRLVTDKGMVMLAKCKNLTDLNISNTSVKSALKEVLKFRNLKVLILHNLNVAKLPLMHISTHLIYLTVLSINFCSKVNQKALMQLKTEMPRLTVHDQYIKSK